MCKQIYALDFRHSGKNLQRLGSAPSSDRFHCLSWGTLRSDLYHVSLYLISQEISLPAHLYLALHCSKSTHYTVALHAGMHLVL